MNPFSNFQVIECASLRRQLQSSARKPYHLIWPIDGPDKLSPHSSSTCSNTDIFELMSNRGPQAIKHTLSPRIAQSMRNADPFLFLCNLRKVKSLWVRFMAPSAVASKPRRFHARNFIQDGLHFSLGHEANHRHIAVGAASR